MAVKQPERRQAPWWVPIVMMCIGIVMMGISACSFVTGPALGAALAIGGSYVRGALTEQRLSSIEKKVDRLVEQGEKKIESDSKVSTTLEDHDRRMRSVEEDVKKLGERVNAQDTKLGTMAGFAAASTPQPVRK